MHPISTLDPARKGRTVTNIVQDDAISLDLQFGTIKFVRSSSGTFALVNVEVSIEDASFPLDPGTKVAMDFRVPVDPEVETVARVTENARLHIIDRLRSVVQILEGKSSQSMLYGDDAGDFFALKL